jgi:hypothetical protein
MKQIQRIKIALALAGLVFAAQHAKAQNASTGDLLLGFNEAGSSNDYVIDIGSASNFLGKSVGTSFTVSNLQGLATDLSTVAFNSSWASNSQTNLVQWGVVGFTTTSSQVAGVAADSLFVTVGEATPGTLATNVPQQKSSSNQKGVITNGANGLTSFVVNINDTDTQSTNVTNTTAVTQPSTEDYSWVDGNPATNAFTTGLDIEQPEAGLHTGPTNSELDLYLLQPGSGNGTYEGSFTLSNAGVLTFTVIPEPSTYAMVLMGFGIFIIFRRIRSHSRRFQSISA